MQRLVVGCSPVRTRRSAKTLQRSAATSARRAMSLMWLWENLRWLTRIRLSAIMLLSRLQCVKVRSPSIRNRPVTRGDRGAAGEGVNVLRVRAHSALLTFVRAHNCRHAERRRRVEIVRDDEARPADFQRSTLSTRRCGMPKRSEEWLSELYTMLPEIWLEF